MSDQIQELIGRALPELVSIRHDLHEHPELMYEERRTSQVVQRELEVLGVRFKAGLAGGTGVIAHLPAGDAGDRPSVALRADMDALPIAERTGKDYASKTPGVMHACGHDGHTAILLGAARVLAALPDRPNPVTFLFQPAEEGGAGAQKMCDDGVLRGDSDGGIGPPVDRIFGLHGWPGLEVGHVATRPGPLLASTDEFTITVHGQGGHAAYPHLTHDPIVAAAAIVTALQTIASRSMAPIDAVVVTVGTIRGGSANNVIPETATLTGTVRTLLPETRDLARDRLFALAQRTAEAYACRGEVDWHVGYPVTNNDPAATEHVLSIARRALGNERVSIVPDPTMGGEDFAFYGKHVPACFYLIGVRPPGASTYPNLHQPEYDFNDDAIPVGVEMMCRLALAQT